MEALRHQGWQGMTLTPTAYQLTTMVCIASLTTNETWWDHSAITCERKRDRRHCQRTIQRDSEVAVGRQLWKNHCTLYPWHDIHAFVTQSKSMCNTKGQWPLETIMAAPLHITSQTWYTCLHHRIESCHHNIGARKRSNSDTTQPMWWRITRASFWAGMKANTSRLYH